MKVRRRYHLHTPGLAFVAVTLLLGLGAVNSQNNLLFIAFGLAVGSILVTGFITGSTMMKVQVERLAPPTARAAEPWHVTYRVRNRSRWLPAFGLIVEERNARPRGSAPEVRTAVRHVPARQRRYARARCIPLRRGVVRLEAVRVWTAFPLGVMKKSATFQQPATALIRPALVPVSAGALEQALARAGRSEAISRRIGRDAEFHSLRPYMPGDPVRRIAWRASARTEDLVVREHYAASSGDVVIALNLSGGADAEPDQRRQREELAISVAASLAERAHVRGARVALIAPDSGDVILSSMDGSPGACDAIHDALARLDLDGDPAVRARRPIPDAAGAVVVIHAHEVDPSIGPAGVTHLSAARAAGRATTPEPQERAA